MEQHSSCGQERQTLFGQCVCHDDASDRHAESKHLSILPLAVLLVDVGGRLDKIGRCEAAVYARRLQDLLTALAVVTFTTEVD